MRHKYATTGIILSRTALGEANLLVTLLTPDLGMVRARAQSARKPGAKLATALQTCVESDVMLVRGKEGWRLSGAVLANDWFHALERPARKRAGRVFGLLLRLIHDDSRDPDIHELLAEFLSVLASLDEELDQELADTAECLFVIRLLRLLGVDAGDIPGGIKTDFTRKTLAIASTKEIRSDLVSRINRGIAASGL